MEATKLIYSSHAVKRMQQRGINSKVVNFIFEHGIKSNTHQDDRYIFNAKKQKQINNQLLRLPIYKKFDKQIQSTALIVNDNHLITAYKINKRLRNA